jgi:hypothetical protein
LYNSYAKSKSYVGFLPTKTSKTLKKEEIF